MAKEQWDVKLVLINRKSGKALEELVDILEDQVEEQLWNTELLRALKRARYLLRHMEVRLADDNGD